MGHNSFEVTRDNNVTFEDLFVSLPITSYLNSAKTILAGHNDFMADLGILLARSNAGKGRN